MTTVALFSHLSNIATVIAFLFAAYQFFLWRKQQRYSLEIEVLLNMEDLFEIYIASLMRAHGYIHGAKELANDAADKTMEDKRNVSEYIARVVKSQLELSANEINENMKSYSLARFRAKRLNLDVESKNELNPEWLRDKFDGFIESESSLNYVANEISKIKKDAYNEFKILRKSI